MRTEGNHSRNLTINSEQQQKRERKITDSWQMVPDHSILVSWLFLDTAIVMVTKLSFIWDVPT